MKTVKLWSLLTSWYWGFCQIWGAMVISLAMKPKAMNPVKPWKQAFNETMKTWNFLTSGCPKYHETMEPMKSSCHQPCKETIETMKPPKPRNLSSSGCPLNHETKKTMKSLDLVYRIILVYIQVFHKMLFLCNIDFVPLWQKLCIFTTVVSEKYFPHDSQFLR